MQEKKLYEFNYDVEKLKSFKKIEEAVQFLRGTNSEVEWRLFCRDLMIRKSYEEEETELIYTGRKKWICASIDSFTRYTLHYIPRHRFEYCVNQEHLPLFGFMDIEFLVDEHKSVMNSSNGCILKEIINIVLSDEVYGSAYEHIFGHKLEQSVSLDQFMILNASNDKKKSLHIHGPYTFAFTNVYHLKVFMNELIARVKMHEIGSKLFFVGSNKKSIIDNGIYQHNHALRLYSCTKITSDDTQYRPLVFDKDLNTIQVSSEDSRSLEQVLFTMSIPFAVPNSTPLVSVSNVHSLKLRKAIPFSTYSRLMNDRNIPEERATFILKEKKVDEAEATHLEWVPVFRHDDLKHFRYVPEDRLMDLYLNMEQSIAKERYHIHEVIHPNVTVKMAIDLHISQSVDIAKMIPAIQRSTNLNGDCLVVSLNEDSTHFRVIWPSIQADIESMKEKCATVSPDLSQCLGESVVRVGHPYDLQYIPMLGSVTQQYHRIKFQGEYDANGNLISNSNTITASRIASCSLLNNTSTK